MIYLFPPAWQDYTLTDAVDWAAQHNGRLRAAPGKCCLELVQDRLCPVDKRSTNGIRWTEAGLLRLAAALRSTLGER